MYKEWKLLQKRKQVGGGGVRVDVNEEVKLLGKVGKNWGVGGRFGGGGVGMRGQGGCDWGNEAFVKIKNKMGEGRSGQVWGGQGGCERRSEAFVKIQKKEWGIGSGGVRSGGRGSGWM